MAQRDPSERYDPRFAHRGEQGERDWGPRDPDLWRDPRLPPRDVWHAQDERRGAPRSSDRDERDRDRGKLQGNFGEVGRHFGFDQPPSPASARSLFRAPKGYKRSDERIREDVSDRLGMRHDLDPTELEVAVQDREVTLSGTVATLAEKFRAEEIAASVGGVEEVHNRLRVRRAD